MRSVGFLVAALALAHVGSPSAQDMHDIGYPSVGFALASLRDRPDVGIKVRQGWTRIVDGAANTVWSFAPRGDVAYRPRTLRLRLLRAARTA